MPWRTLIDNVSFPLQLAGAAKSDRHDRAAELIAMVGLAGFEKSYPHELSGGMRQRANIIRTLIYSPKVILMDEPFGPLDAQTCVLLQDQLLNIWSQTGVTIIFITHDLHEAIGLGDRVVLLSSRPGRIIRVDKVRMPRPRDVFRMHDSDEFRSLYDAIWVELERQVREQKVDRPLMNAESDDQEVYQSQADRRGETAISPTSGDRPDRAHRRCDCRLAFG